MTGDVVEIFFPLHIPLLRSEIGNMDVDNDICCIIEIKIENLIERRTTMMGHEELP